MSLWQRIKNFFGLGEVTKVNDTEAVYKDLLNRISSHEKLQEVNAKAYQLIIKQQPLTPGVAHPYEVTIAGDCLAVDAAISTHFSSKLRDFSEDATYVETLLRNGVNAELASVKPNGLEMEVAAKIAQAQPLADELRQKKKEADTNLHNFRQANNLLISAAPPDQSNAMAIIIAIAIAEAVMNWLFLREYQQAFIAIIIAAGAAIINVAGNVHLGARYREKNHIEVERSNRGKLNLSFAIALIIGLNGVLALFRLWYSDWSMTPQVLLEIFMLFAIGVFLGIAAFNKGYALDDPYPGHGDLTRRANEANEQWMSIQTQHAEFCERLKKNAVETHTSLVSRIRSNSNQLMGLLPEMSGALSGWVGARDQLNSSYRALQCQFKTALRNAHPSGADYPLNETDLPSNTLYDTFKVLADRFTDSRSETEARISKLIKEVETSRDSLQKWMTTAAAERLWRWPN